MVQEERKQKRETKRRKKQRKRKAKQANVHSGGQLKH